VDRLPVGWDEGPGLVASVWRYRWLVAAVALAGVLAGVGLSLVQPVMYEASSRVLLKPQSSDSQEEPDRVVRNEAAFMVSPPVLDRAVRGVKGRVTVKQLRERLVAEPSTESDLVTLTVRDATARGAAELVDAVGQAYRATAIEHARADRQRAVEQLQQTQKELRGRLAPLQARVDADPENASLKAQRDAVAGLLTEAIGREQELQGSPADDPVALLEKAEVPEDPAQPKPLRLVALGGLLGGLLATGLASLLAGRRPARPRGPLPPALPGAARPAGARVRLSKRLRSRLPTRRKAAPNPSPPSGARPAHARERLVATLGAERRRQGEAATITEEHRNGHRSTGNGSGKLGDDLGHLAKAGGEPPATPTRESRTTRHQHDDGPEGGLRP
jgi:uncharacterized protein involved in exopolysaccharide biosynthesis